LTADLAARLVEGTQAQAAGRSVGELERRRDDFLVRLLQLVREYWPSDDASQPPREDGNDER
jgi:carnitine 3-dehydrogenase